MTSPGAWFGWRPTPATLIASVVVVGGLLLLTVSWWFFGLVALGAFGPGILRELGCLRDKDEFERRAAHRAGYHAYLVGGLVGAFLVAYLRSGDRSLEHPSPPVTLILVILWFTWLLSSLLAYWGPQKTTIRLLIAFGAGWLFFNILGNTGDQYSGFIGLIMQSLLALPFLVLAWVAHRWPRVAAILLLAVSAFFIHFFGLYKIIGPQPFAAGRAFVIVLFVGPLLACGLALLRRETEEVLEDEA